jgi:hypothetical protein
MRCQLTSVLTVGAPAGSDASVCHLLLEQEECKITVSELKTKKLKNSFVT